jgi:hypothetical protein
MQNNQKEIKNKISESFNYSFSKSKKFFSDEEIKTFKTISSFVLGVVAVSGIIVLSAAAPNLIGALGKIASYKIKGKNYTKKEKAKKIIQTIYYLKKSGLIHLNSGPSGVSMSLTEKGKEKVNKINLGLVVVSKKPQWDKKWWLVAADIPTLTHRQGADLFRRKLKEMGFKSLQRTLWINPFDPRKEIQFIAEYFGLEKFITVMEINRLDIEDEKILKQHYQIK